MLQVLRDREAGSRRQVDFVSVDLASVATALAATPKRHLSRATLSPERQRQERLPHPITSRISVAMVTEGMFAPLVHGEDAHDGIDQ